jgi:transcription elongation factor Elf1
MGVLDTALITLELSADAQMEIQEEWIKGGQQVSEEMLQGTLAAANQKLFRCRFCSFVAKSEHDMQVHIGKHLKEEDKDGSVCPVCNRKLISEVSLARHMKKLHNFNMPGAMSTEDRELIQMYDKYICEVDPTDPSSWDKELIENYADPKLTNPLELKKQPKEDDGLTCEDCGYKGSKVALYKHRMRHHTDNVEKCHLCFRTFKLATDLAVHMKIHEKKKKKGSEEELKKRFLCRLCGYRSNVHAVRLHMKRIHRPGGYPCEKCNARFATKLDLNRHAKSHMSVEQVEQGIQKRRRGLQRIFECHLCPYTTRHSQTDLKEHIARKHEEPKLKCEYCGKMFGVQYDLNDHINHMHLKIKRVVCDICGLEVHRKNLKTHMARAHEKLKPYQCDICHRRFGDRKFMLRHK